MKRFTIILSLVFIGAACCFNEQSSIEKIDQNLIEDDYEHHPNFEHILTYLKEKESYANRFYWDEEYKILRHLFFGDSLDTEELKRKLIHKRIRDGQIKMMLDSFNIPSFELMGKEIKEGELLRIIITTSIIPFAKVVTIKKTKDQIQLHHKSCIFTYRWPETGGAREFEIKVNGEIKKGKYIDMIDEHKLISQDQFFEIKALLPNYSRLKSDYEFENGRMLDGEYIIIEYLEKYDEDIEAKVRYSASVVGVWWELSTFLEELE